MFGLLLGLIDPVSRIVGKIADARAEAAKAATDQERIHAEERAKVLEARRDVLVAEAGGRLNSTMRACFAAPFALYNAKLVIWDKMMALGSTDGLSPELYHVEMACIGFYFLYEAAARLKR